MRGPALTRVGRARDRRRASDRAETLPGLCRRFDRLERRRLALFGAAAGEAERAAAMRRQRLERQQAALLDRITSARATTLEDVVARARTLDLWTRDLGSYDGGTWDDRMTAALVRDLVGLGAEGRLPG